MQKKQNSIGKSLDSLQWFLWIAGIPFMAFALFMFYQITDWGHEWNRKKGLVDSGEIQPVSVKVLKKEKNTRTRRTGKTTRTETDYIVLLGTENNERISRSLGVDLWNSLSIQQAFDAYPIEDEYFIPTTDVGGHMKYRWFFFAFGASPMVIGTVIFVVRKSISSRGDQRRFGSASTT